MVMGDNKYGRGGPVGDFSRGLVPALAGGSIEEIGSFVGFMGLVAREYKDYYPSGMGREVGTNPGATWERALGDLEYFMGEGHHGGLLFNRYCKFVAHLVCRLPLNYLRKKEGSGFLGGSLGGSLECLFRFEGAENSKAVVGLLKRTDKILKRVARLPFDGDVGGRLAKELHEYGYTDIDTSEKGFRGTPAEWQGLREKSPYKQSRARYEAAVKGDSLGFAAARGDALEVKCCLAEGVSFSGANANTSDLPLVMAAVGGSTEVVDHLLRAGANIDMVSLGRAGIPPGLSVQSVAAIYGKQEFFDKMVSLGADPGVVLKQRVGNLSVYEWVEAKAAKERAASPAEDIRPYQGMLERLETLGKGKGKDAGKGQGSGLGMSGKFPQSSARTQL